MEPHFQKAAFEILSNSLFLFAVVFAMILAILSVLLPIFVYKIMRNVENINRKINEIDTRFR